MRRFMPLSVLAVAGLAAAGATVGSAGARSQDSKRCEDRLVQTLTVQMSSTSPVTSLRLDTGGTYFVYVNGSDLRTHHPALSVNGTPLNWVRPLDRPGIVVSASPSGPRVGVGIREIAYAQTQQALATLSGKEGCYVTPPSRWLSLPAVSGGLSFAPYTQPGFADNRTLTIQIYQSEFTTPGPEKPPTAIPPPSVRYAFTFSGDSPLTGPGVDDNGKPEPGVWAKWSHVSGSGWISTSGAFASGVYTLLFDDNGKPDLRRMYFHLRSRPELPVDRWTRLAAAVSRSDRRCAHPGADISIYLDNRTPGKGLITVDLSSCHDYDRFGVDGRPGSTATVSFERIKGKG